MRVKAIFLGVGVTNFGHHGYDQKKTEGPVPHIPKAKAFACKILFIPHPIGILIFDAF